MDRARIILDDTWAHLTIWQEARGETREGRLAVAEVIRNRMRARYSSDGTAAGTVLKAYQFSGWNTQDPNRIACTKLAADDPLILECAEVWAEAKAGSNLVLGALLYYAPAGVKQTPAWALTSRKVAIIGRHHFFVPA